MVMEHIEQGSFEDLMDCLENGGEILGIRACIKSKDGSHSSYVPVDSLFNVSNDEEDDYDDTYYEDLIIRHFRLYDKFMTLSELQEAVDELGKLSFSELSDILKGLVDDEKLVRIVDKKRAYYRLKK